MGFLAIFPAISDTLWRSVVNYWRETDHKTGRKYRLAVCHSCIEGISPSLGLQFISVVATRDTRPTIMRSRLRPSSIYSRC